MPQNNRLDSLSYLMTRNALSEKSRDPEHAISDRDTKRTYKASIKRFCTWTKENGYTREDVLSNPQPYLQQYADNLKARGLSAATIHTYIAPCCKGLNTPMQHISKPDRAVRAITRSRGGKNPRGRKDAEKPEYARLVAFQSAVGLRRAELAHLKGEDLRLNNPARRVGRGFHCSRQDFSYRTGFGIAISSSITLFLTLQTSFGAL